MANPRSYLNESSVGWKNQSRNHRFLIAIGGLQGPTGPDRGWWSNHQRLTQRLASPSGPILFGGDNHGLPGVAKQLKILGPYVCIIKIYIWRPFLDQSKCYIQHLMGCLLPKKNMHILQFDHFLDRRNSSVAAFGNFWRENHKWYQLRKTHTTCKLHWNKQELWLEWRV